MIELTLLRVFVAVSMLGVASYYDLRTREISDWVWIVFGIGGAFLYLFEWSIFSNTLFWIGLGVFLAGLMWLLRMCGGADILAIIAISVILPTYNGVSTTVVALLIAFTSATAYAVSNNIYKNAKLLISGKELFSDVNETLYKKLFAFFVIHQRSENERFGFSGVDKRCRFVFRHDPDTAKFEAAKYVTTTVPMMPFLLIGVVFSILISSFDHIL